MHRSPTATSGRGNCSAQMSQPAGSGNTKMYIPITQSNKWAGGSPVLSAAIFKAFLRCSACEKYTTVMYEDTNPPTKNPTKNWFKVRDASLGESNKSRLRVRGGEQRRNPNKTK